MKLANKHNYLIDLFRFGIILWIILFHYTYIYNDMVTGGKTIPFVFNNGGPVGVTLFFILSGYYMGHTLFECEKFTKKGYFRYCVSRYLRFWPSYAISVVLIFIWMLFFPLDGLTVSIKEFLINLIFIIHPKIEYVDGAHWFLAALLTIQLITALLIFLPLNIRLFSLVFFCVLFALATLCFYLMDYEKSYPLVLLQSETKLLLGIAIYRLTKEMSLINIILIGIMGGVVFLIMNNELIPLIVSIMILFFCLFVNIDVSFFLQPIIRYFGDLSFTWYLIHQHIGFSILSRFDHVGVGQFCIPIVITLLLAGITKHFSARISKAFGNSFYKKNH